MLLLASAFHILVTSQYIVELGTAFKDKALTGFAFQNFTMKTMADCFLACFNECLCMSFQFWNRILSTFVVQSFSIYVETKDWLHLLRHASRNITKGKKWIRWLLYKKSSLPYVVSIKKILNFISNKTNFIWIKFTFLNSYFIRSYIKRKFIFGMLTYMNDKCSAN
jgi:Flp pilus assembly protein protease CpaA